MSRIVFYLWKNPCYFQMTSNVNIISREMKTLKQWDQGNVGSKDKGDGGSKQRVPCKPVQIFQDR